MDVSLNGMFSRTGKKKGRVGVLVKSDPVSDLISTNNRITTNKGVNAGMEMIGHARRGLEALRTAEPHFLRPHLHCTVCYEKLPCVPTSL